MKTLIVGRAVVTFTPSGLLKVLPDHGVLVEGERIVAVDAARRLRRAYPRARRLGGKTSLVLPGIVNAHAHGMGISHVELGTLDQPLEIWNVLRLGRPKPPRRAETALSSLRQLRAGITTTVHSQAGGDAKDADEILWGYRDAGIRTVMAVHARNQNHIAYEADRRFLARLPRDVSAALLRAFPPPPEDYAERYFGSFRDLASRHEGPRVSLAYGPAGIQWVDPEFLRHMAERCESEGRVMHTHLLESPYEAAYGPRKLGVRTITWLDRHGVLGARFTGAHGVWLSMTDLRRLARAKASLVHCPSSNLRLSSGLMPLREAIDAGVNVALGTDSCTLGDDEDPWTEMRLALRLHNDPGLEGRRIAVAEVLWMATGAGARSIARDDVGTLTPGALADLIVLDAEAIDPRQVYGGEDTVEAIVARAKPEHVRMTMVGGEVLVSEGRHGRLSESDLERAASRPSPERSKLVAIRRFLVPEVLRFYGGWRLPVRPRPV